MTFTDTDIMNAYDKTSLETQDMLFSFETRKLIDSVCSQNNLNKEEQKNIVADEILYLLIGLTKREELGSRLSQLLEVSAETAKKISDELVSKLFNRPTSGIREPSLSPAPAPQEPSIRMSRPGDGASSSAASQDGTKHASSPQKPSPVAKGPVPDADSSVREKLELRPQGVPHKAETEEEPVAKPLTREDVLSALSPRRTMKSDIESVRKSDETKTE